MVSGSGGEAKKEEREERERKRAKGERGSGPTSISTRHPQNTRCSVGLSCPVEERPGSGPTSDNVMDGGEKLGPCDLLDAKGERVVSEYSVPD